MCKVSVIIPVYNVEKYLGDCLDSVLNQTLEDLEVICIDDASPDRCGMILDSYAEKDSRVHVIHLPDNHMQGYGRNLGLDQAKGEYVYFLDSDDLISRSALEELYTIASEDFLDGIFFDAKPLFEERRFALKHSDYDRPRKGCYRDEIYAGPELFEAFSLQSDWSVLVQCQFWKRFFLIEQKVRFLEETEHEDEWFSFQAILLAQRVRYVPEPYFTHRYRSDSVMTREAHPKDFHGYFINYRAMVDFVEEHDLVTPGTENNIFHIYERILQFYDIFDAQEDPLSWFRTEDERRDYLYLRHAKHGKVFYQNILARMIEDEDGDSSILDLIAAGEIEIWIYGAGIIGRKVCSVFENLNYVVGGFLVSETKDNPRAVLGRKVFGIDEVCPSDNRVAVIALSAAYHSEVKAMLETHGWKYLIYHGWR